MKKGGRNARTNPARLRPTDVIIRGDLAGIQISLGKVEKAAADIKAVLHLDDGNAKVHYKNARLLTKLHKRELARAELDRSETLRQWERDWSAMQLAEVK